jgi:hypothetical protein
MEQQTRESNIRDIKPKDLIVSEKQAVDFTKVLSRDGKVWDQQNIAWVLKQVQAAFGNYDPDTWGQTGPKFFSTSDLQQFYSWLYTAFKSTPGIVLERSPKSDIAIQNVIKWGLHQLYYPADTNGHVYTNMIENAGLSIGFFTRETLAELHRRREEDKAKKERGETRGRGRPRKRSIQ